MAPTKIGKNLTEVIFRIKREKIILNYIKTKKNCRAAKIAAKYLMLRKTLQRIKEKIREVRFKRVHKRVLISSVMKVILCIQFMTIASYGSIDFDVRIKRRI